MSRRRPSMSEILAEERAELELPKAPVVSAQPAHPSQELQKEPATSTKRADKSDYVRLSVTLPPELFERLQSLSLTKRRAKEPYTFCHLARQAIAEWLDQQEQT